QVGDVELDDVGLASEVVVPHPIEDLRLRQHPLGVAHQEAQQLELGRGQVDLRTCTSYLVAVLVELEVADGEHRSGVGAAGTGPSQQSAQPGDQLLQGERLGDVVV